GVPVWNGTTAFAAFRAEARGAESTILFFWPPTSPEDTLPEHSLSGAGNTPISATFEIEGGQLTVPAPSFSPPSPAAGKPVSFDEAPPDYKRGKPLADVAYAWHFDNGGKAAGPTANEVFELQPGEGPHTFHATVTITAKAPEGPVSGVSPEVALTVTPK